MVSACGSLRTSQCLLRYALKHTVGHVGGLDRRQRGERRATAGDAMRALSLSASPLAAPARGTAARPNAVVTVQATAPPPAEGRLANRQRIGVDAASDARRWRIRCVRSAERVRPAAAR
jgi:hypothetical protein